MQPSIVCISGHVSAGKSTLALGLEQAFSGHLVSSRAILQERRGSLPLTRFQLQELGRAWDQRTAGTWLRDALIAETVAAELVIVDAVRTSDQVAALREFGETLHVHLTCAIDALRVRYEARRVAHPELELQSFDDVAADPTERQIYVLEAIADTVIDSSAEIRATNALAVASVKRWLSH